MHQVPNSCCVPGPNLNVIEWVKKQRPMWYAEIGVYEGATATEVAKVLDEDAHMDLFDFYDRLDFVRKRLEAVEELQDKSLYVKMHGNSRLLFDSYNWSLAKVLEEAAGTKIYDFVYIDGAHSWHHDALSFMLVDRLLYKHGIVVFDDYGWTFSGSPTMSPGRFPDIVKQYTAEQIVTPQVNMVVDLLVKPHYKELIPNMVYQKV